MMTRILKISGFLGLATTMVVGLYQYMLLTDGSDVPGWLISSHAYLGVLSILAIVTGFAVEAFNVTGWLRTTVTGLFLAGQWLLPLTIWIGVGGNLTFLMPTAVLWGLCLIATMGLMAWQAAQTPTLTSEQPPTETLTDEDTHMTTPTCDYKYHHHGETICVAVRCSGAAHEPHVWWQIGDWSGECDYVHLDSAEPVIQLEEGETVRLGGRLVTTIPVPEQIGNALNDQILELGTITVESERLVTDPGTFPLAIDGFDQVGWESKYNVMWYWRDNQSPPRAYQIEDGVLVFRAQEWIDPAASRQALLDRYDLRELRSVTPDVHGVVRRFVSLPGMMRTGVKINNNQPFILPLSKYFYRFI